MRNPRIFTPQPLASGTDIVLEAAASKHVLKVLRLQKNAPVRLFNGDGHDYQASVTGGVKLAELHIDSAEKITNESPLYTHLIQGLSRGERMDFAIQKAVEMGVNEITPVITERNVVKIPAERMAKKLAHWRGVIISACEQSGRAVVPVLNSVISLDKLFKQPLAGDKIVLNPLAEQSLAALNSTGNLNILIGPEGGLSDSEITLAEQHGYTGVQIGGRILRTETAALAVLASAQTLWGDWA